MSTERELSRFILDAALGFYSAGIFVLALFPTSEIRYIEWICMALAVISAIGLAAHALPNVYLPGEKYARLFTGAAGLNALFLYLIFTKDPEYEAGRMGLLIFSGVIASWGSYLVEYDGEKHRG